ncbi:hypothetical protein [Streptomyces yangpuensis]|uniref:hypothetical protein n=1 Tax=Streptomyces yangpuensis TaxID=1648182 RepID=UPI0012FE9AE6|nr:hypothetical protein [Streptomyces yangpuensis]
MRGRPVRALPARGCLILGVVHGRIMFVEVLDRPEPRPVLRGALTGGGGPR